MSLSVELRLAIGRAEQDLFSQAGELNNFLSEIDALSKRIDSALSGDPDGFDKQMVEQIAETKKQIEETIKMLHFARSKLEQFI